MKKLVILILVIVAFSSCEKLLMPKKPSKTPNEVFESLWKTIDENYVYFETNELDWDSVYREFQPKFFDTMTDRQLYDTCRMMLARLKDPYVKLMTPFAESHFDDTIDYAKNFNLELLKRHYWKDYEKTGPFVHTILDSIGYVYLDNFEETIHEDHLDAIIKKLRFEDSIKGVVFDVRNNKGGDVKNVFTLLKRMGPDTSYKVTAVVFKAKYKNGPEHDAFTDVQTSYIEQDDKTKFPKQFVLLANRKTAGVGALFVAGAKAFNNVKVMGDTTGGGASSVVAKELPNAWRVTFPASIFYTNDEKLIEEGVAPSTYVPMKPADEAQGIDSILEEALKELRKH